MLTRAAVPGTDNPSATELEPGLLAPYHQHIFCARLDMAVDGEENTVVEVDVVSEPMGAANPAGNAYQLRETVLASESVARRVIEPYASRTWTVINPGSTNHMGKPVGYKLVPTGVTWPQADPESGKKPVFFSHLYINVNMIIFPNRLGTNTGKPQKRDRHVAQ